MAAVMSSGPSTFHRKPVVNYTHPNPYQQAPVDSLNAPQYVRAPTTARVNDISTQPAQAPGQSRRTLSNGTSSTSSTNNNNNNNNNLQKVVTNNAYTGGVRRSTSSRSNGSASPTSYVALMRKQKATVWCDRAQHQDPRIIAAQRQAKMRAVMEVAGGQNHSPQARASTSSSGITSGVRSKIRHHGAPKAKDYNSGNLSGAGVPMRLSATEVDEGESDEERSHHQHQRASSSRSSLGSARTHGYGSKGYDASPPSGASPVESMGDLAEEETPMPEHHAHQNDYFGQTGGTGGSGSSGEGEQSFGKVGGLPQTTTTRQRADSEQLSGDERRRRGSVDDRTMTLSGVRLFVANPDLSD